MIKIHTTQFEKYKMVARYLKLESGTQHSLVFAANWPAAAQTTFVFIVTSRRMLINMREGNTQISPHQDTSNKHPAPLQTTAPLTATVSQIAHWAFTICHLLFTRKINIFSSHPGSVRLSPSTAI